MLRIALFSLLALIALPASAQIYQYTDANGNTVFSDQPPTGRQAKSVKLPPVNAVPKQVVSEPLNTLQPAEGGSEPYDVLRLVGLPGDGGTVRANNGSFSVNVDIAPPLQNRHRLRLLLDGEPYGEPSRQPLFELVNLDRGEHRLAVEVLSGDTPVQQSKVERFTVQRSPSVSVKLSNPIVPISPPPPQRMAPRAKQAKQAPRAKGAP